MAYKNIFCVRSSRSAHYEIIIIEGSLEVKLPTIWTDGKAEVVRVREEKRREERRSEKRKSQKNEDAGARKDRKVAIHCLFPMICGPGGSKSRLAKVAGAEPSGRMRDEKLHAVGARSRFPSQNGQRTSVSDRFWKLSCGVKHISESKCAEHTSSGSLLEVEMSKRCTPLWSEAHFQVKTLQAPHGRTTFEGSDVFLRGRRKGFCTLPKANKT